MASKRSRRQIERLKKARSAKTGRFVVVHTKSGAIRSVVRGKGAGKAVPKAKTYGAIVAGTRGGDAGSRQPRPRVPLLSGGKDPKPAGGSERTSTVPDALRGWEADDMAEPRESKGFRGRPKVLDLLGAGGLDEEEARVYAREVVRIVRGGSRAPEAPAPDPEAVRERREARRRRDG